MQVDLSRGAVVILYLAAACISRADGARAEEDWAATRESFICKSSTEVREIKTYNSVSPAGASAAARSCRVDYIKNGSTKTIWSSRTNGSFCDGKASQLAARLEASNFSCSALHLQRSDEP